MEFQHLLLRILPLVPFFLSFLESDGQNATINQANCPEQYCGDILVHYPFYLTDRNSPSSIFCGYQGLGVTCQDVPKFYLNGSTDDDAYIFKNINYTDKTLTLVDPYVMENSTCPRPRQNLTNDWGLPLQYSRENLDLTYYFNCSSGFVHGNVIECSSWEGNSSHIVEGLEPEYVDWFNFCEEKVSTTLIRRGITDGWTSVGYGRVMAQGFKLEWRTSTGCQRCEESNGKCGFSDSTDLLCFCSNNTVTNTYCKDGHSSIGNSSTGNIPITVNPSSGNSSTGNTPTPNSFRPQYTPSSSPSPIIVPNPGGSSKRIPLIVGLTVALAIVILVAILYFRLCNLVVGRPTRLPDRKENKFSAFMKQFESSGPKRYSYSDIREMTNSFADKLGQGGFGSVYKGKLRDGRQVAVKVLNRVEENGEDFINEVASISRTSHVNVITFLGFCYDGKKRALIFEFMPNGSLDRYLSSDLECCLDWKTLFQISIGSARGLEYLHRGCNTRIVHFDIKPHNILLDDNFCPKISDFGLAKFTLAKESILSKCSARGTVGYIAPEVFFRQFGGVSHKSDVYSYGMMILEMVGVRTNSGVQVDRSSQNYFPQWIYDHLEFGSSLNIQVVHDEEEEEISKKLILVGLWSIQTNPSDRPSMGKVVEMLEGSLQALQMPPKPFLHSPLRPTQQSSPMSMQQSSTTLA